MQDLNDKVTGNALTAVEWNEVPSEIQNVIEALGQTLSSGDLDQLGKGIAGYVANGNFYTDSGAADAYVLTKIGTKQATTAYTDGSEVFFVAGNRNLTATPTVNVQGLGVKSISGAPINSLEGIVRLKYSAGAGSFTLMGSQGFQKIGLGVKGSPQTNVAFQIHRDITNNGASSHGFNCADYFADDTLALNPFGSDIKIGDDTQTTEVLNHVNSFQSTNQINLNTATISLHNGFVAQDVLVSGTVSRSNGFQVIDLLGVRDTPGFGVAGFDVTATSNNPTGISATIRHGTNAKTFHALAGNTDAGAVLTSGGARSDFECPVFMRQADDSTSRTTGALVLTDGGIGCDGNIFGGAEVSAAAATAVLGMRSAANSLLGSVSSTSTLTSLTNVFSGTLEFGVSNTAELRLLSDRFVPVTDDDQFLGDATHRWKQLFAITATINTSDENSKTNIIPIDDALLDAWESVQAVIFQFKDAANEKGDNARLHSGYIAQQVQNALESKGLDGFKYGLLCKDELKKSVKKTRLITRQKKEQVERKTEVLEKNNEGLLVRKIVKELHEVPMLENLQVFNEDGTEYLVESHEQQKVKGIIETIAVMRPVIQSYPVMEEVEEEYEVEEPSGEYRMGLRYHECAVIEAAYLRREIYRIKQS